MLLPNQSQEFVITGTSGDKSASRSIIVVFKDPCIDPNYVTVIPATLVDQEYTLSTNAPNGLQYTHDAVTYTTSPIQHTLCGEATYTATFNGNAIGPSDTPMKYDSATRTISFYSDDSSLVGTQAFSVTAQLGVYG